MNIIIARLLFIVMVTFVATGSATQEESWVSRSDRNTEVLLEVLARFNPEGAGFLGIEGLDEQVLQLPSGLDDRQISAFETAITDLRARLEAEPDARVRLDLEILVDATEFNIEQTRLNREHLLPTFNLSRIVFQGVRSLLDDQSSPEQRGAVEVRLRRYAGLEEGFTPLTEQAEELIRSRLARPGLVGPYLGEIKRDLTMSDRYISGIRELLAEFEISGCERYVDVLADQVNSYNEFLRNEMLPRARQDFRLPPAIYAQLLEAMGVDMPIAELSSRAHVSFHEIQNEMQAIAALIAESRNLESADYRDVIRHLKREQFVGEEIIATYTTRIEELEEIIQRHGVVTLPQRKMRIRLASEAESAAIPSPYMQPPRLIGNTGEMGEFVLPFRVAVDTGNDSPPLDDYTFAAASWTLAVHEGRPGHELQFSAMIENGVSLARSIFAFNSVNVEGWALYCEAEMKPYFPLDGQLISLQQRLLRSARAFLDPGLQNGTISEDEARRILENDLVLSAAGVQKELDRYTYLDPAQATSYFCGYLRLMELRAEAERKMGDRFDREAYHDFILSQGLLPPRLMRKAVLEGFVGRPDVP
jgi:hypothetical protein